MTNALDLNAPVDTLAMEFTREFDAPVGALFRAHAEPDLLGLEEKYPALPLINVARQMFLRQLGYPEMGERQLELAYIELLRTQIP